MNPIILFLPGALVILLGFLFVFLPLITEMNKPKPVEPDPDDVAVKLLGSERAHEYRRQVRRRQAVARARARSGQDRQRPCASR